MLCPYCGYIDQRVLDSRPARGGESIRRRRECNSCGRRFTTFEAHEKPRLFVAKRDGTRQEFSEDKVLNSLLIACRKRRIPIEELQEAVARVQRDLTQRFEEEVPSSAIGEMVLRELQPIDTVAYIRFASVYKEFETTADFEEIIRSMQEGEAMTAARL